MLDFIRLYIKNKGNERNATPDIARPCVQSKGEDGMRCQCHLTVYTVQKAMMAFNAQLGVMPNGDTSIVMHNVVQSCVQSKVDDNMPLPTLSYSECPPRVIMVCHARRYSTLSMLFKGDDGLPRPTLFDSVL